MITDNTARWIENLAPRLRDYLRFTDRTQEASEADDLSAKAKYYFGTGLLEDFFGSDYYNADFDPQPEEGVKVTAVRDLSALVEGVEDREKLEESISNMLDQVSGKIAPEAPAGDNEAGEMDKEKFQEMRKDPFVNGFFNMMTDSLNMQGYYDGVESQMQSIIGDYDGSDLEDEIERVDADQMSSSLDDLMAEMLDGHIDTGDGEDK
ncbi:MAG: hypothetical protein SOV71_05735 [Anaerovoracaceae bacterium]|jgi:hypothetical protein|nr:hypothetical protein [Bacillota bacterium]MDY2671037.1 hypothetical protein [Anaerovoracaceae bacterium]